MKKIVYLFLPVFFSLVLASCEDEVKSSNEAPSRVADASIGAGAGEIYLAWQTPDDANLGYIRIEYTNEKGEKVNKLVNNKNIDPVTRITKDTIVGFVTTVERSFTVYTCNFRGTNRGGIQLSKAPLEPVFNKVLETITIKPDAGGVNIGWENDFYRDAYVVVNYSLASNPQKSGSKRFAAKGNQTGEDYVFLIADGQLLAGNECDISVAIEDSEGNSSEKKTAKLTPSPIFKMDKSKLSFPGYDENSSAETIGYSSQEAGGEGAIPNGRVAAMLDGNLSTYWHSRWGNPAAVYPHWFILDLGADVQVSNVELAKRIGFTNMQIGFQLSTCSDANAVDKTDPSTWNWDDQGSYPFDPFIDGMQNYRIKNNPNVRYLKFYLGTEHKGRDIYAMISELDVYTAE